MGLVYKPDPRSCGEKSSVKERVKNLAVLEEEKEEEEDFQESANDMNA
jgi:hypothetical protein